LFLSDADVMKSSSLDCQLEFQEKNKSQNGRFWGVQLVWANIHVIVGQKIPA
jgi:hypothetical protein